MFPRQIATGVILLIIAVGGLVYVFARPKPKVETLQDEPLELRVSQTNRPVIVPPPEPQPSVETVGDAPATYYTQPKPIKTYTVNLLSPTMAQTFVAPAKIKLRAIATRERQVIKIEFYKSPDGTVCQSLATPDALPNELKIGEAIDAPYETNWDVTEVGTYTIIAVASYNDGAQQLSAPIVIIVNDKKDDVAKWSWMPDYPPAQLVEQEVSLLASPTPTPILASCPSVSVKALPVSTQSNIINFQAIVSGGEVPGDLGFKWKVSAGEVVSGADSSTISVKVDKIRDLRVIAAVEVTPLNFICQNSAYTSVAFTQPSWATKDFRNLLLEYDLDEEPDAGDKRIVSVYEGHRGCVNSNDLKQARALKRYFVEYLGMKSADVQIVNAGKLENEDSDYIQVSTLREGEQPEESLGASLKRPLVACSENAFLTNAGYETPAPPINRSCPDIDEKADYSSALDLDLETINACPVNPRDPLNTASQVKLLSGYSGTYSNVPTFEYWVNAGKLLSNHSEGDWDLSTVRLMPGEYTVVAKANDGCDCTNIVTKTVTVTNFCTPCLTMEQVCWTPPDGVNQQKFRAQVGGFATTKRAGFFWTISKGKIIEGQGTNEILVDYGSLPPGENVVATVAVDGLLSYCVNKISHPAIVGVIVCGPQPPKDVLLAGSGIGRLARRREQQTRAETKSGSSSEQESSPPGEGPPPNPQPSDEKEWLKISWTPKVSTDDSAVVTVVYKRTSESLHVSNSAGETTDEIKLGKLLVEWFGKDYETFGDVRLKTAGVKCDSCNESQFQSFDKDQLEWSWPIKPESKGRQSFNIELWVKGEPRDRSLNLPSKPAEKVWSKNNNVIEVSEPVITRNTIFAGGGMCAVLGLGLCVRGIKFYRIGDTYNVGQAVAVGRNVTMNNATINQPASNKPENGENKDA